MVLVNIVTKSKLSGKYVIRRKVEGSRRQSIRVLVYRAPKSHGGTLHHCLVGSGRQNETELLLLLDRNSRPSWRSELTTSIWGPWKKILSHS